MKIDTRHNLGWGARMRLFGRIAGLTGLFAGLVGLFLLLATNTTITIDSIKANLNFNTFTMVSIGSILFVFGVLIAALIAVLEVLGWLGGSGQRSATGLNSVAQIALALAVFAGLNVLGFQYFKRWDLTRDRQFTLPNSVVTELRKLKENTTIVVLQRHKTFGQLSEKTDVYDSAAERKVVDKVRDLVDQFRLLGPKFHVVALDVEAENYSSELEAVSADRPGLKEAIGSAPENSIFFYADGRRETVSAAEALRRNTEGRRVYSLPITGDETSVLAYDGNIPRLSFNEFYQLDKSASKTANRDANGVARGNLVLRPQGVETFARRILAIQERRPRIGLLVIHEVLTSAANTAQEDRFTALGMRRTLEDHGFDVIDVVVKKWGEQGGPQPAAYNVAETQFERLEAEREGVEEQIRDNREERKDALEAQKIFRDKSLAELDKMFRPQLRREFTEDIRQDQLRAIGDAVKQIDERLAELAVERRDAEAKLQAVLRNERAFEDRRVTEVKAKMSRLTAECDLLIVPRLTVLNASAAQNIDPPFYRLSTEQVEVVKDFMKSGKPVMVCAGPNVESNAAASAEPLDDLERLLADRGILLGRETIITNAEVKGFAARRAGSFLGGTTTDIPAVTVSSKPEKGKDNPVAAAMRSMAASADMKLDLKFIDPRPVYLVPGLAGKLGFPPDFLVSTAAAWNEEKPIEVRNIGGGRGLVVPPRFKPTPFGDSKKGTHEEVRRGPFPLAVAVESTIPVEWHDKDFGLYRGATAIADPLAGGLLAAGLTLKSNYNFGAKSGPTEQSQRKIGRVIAIGHGGIFTGKQLAPANEQLLLHSTNWLLRRDERLPKVDTEWSFPRLHRAENQDFIWRYGPLLGLPLAFLYVGLLVWFVRRVR